MSKRIKPEDSKLTEATSQHLANGHNAGKWSDEEHSRFLDALKIYGNLWKKVKDCVKTRSCAQIRSHCQKYFRRKRNMMLQELRRTNRLKGMVFLVIEEYFNRTSPSSTKHSDNQLSEEAKEDGNEDGNELCELSQIPQGGPSSGPESEIIILKDPGEDEALNFTSIFDKQNMLSENDLTLNDTNQYDSEYHFRPSGLYEGDNEY